MDMRVRRTNKEVEQDIFDAVTKISQKEDLTKITFRKVANLARVDMKVLKRRYLDVPDLLSSYSSQFDQRLTELMKSGEHLPGKAERYGFVFGRFLEWVSDNEQIRQLLLWELDEQSDLGYWTGQKRDVFLTKLLAEDFGPQPQGSAKEQVRGQIILYLAGMTYLYLNRSDAAFMGIKYFSEEGKVRLQEGMNRLLQIYFAL